MQAKVRVVGAEKLPYLTEAGFSARTTNLHATGCSRLYQIRSNSPLLGFSRRDVPPERLYKIMRFTEKGGKQPGFGIRGQGLGVSEIPIRDESYHVRVITYD